MTVIRIISNLPHFLWYVINGGARQIPAMRYILSVKRPINDAMLGFQVGYLISACTCIFNHLH